jgi:glycosyltransferase involved in cell wall biosynthesis
VSLEEAQLTHYDAVLSFSHKIPLGVWVDTIKANKKIQWIHTDLTAFPFRGFDDSLIEKIDAFVGSSDSVTQGFQKLFPVQSAKISTIHTPCDVAKIRQLATVEQRQIKQGTMAIVTACRLSPEQGLERAIRVCKRLETEMIPFRWYVVGAGNKAYEQKLRTLVDTSGLQEKFVFLGSSANPLPFIRAADIFVLPARVEGYAQSITEAQILGRAVVAANAGGASEQITNGVNGVLVLDSEQGMYEGIQKLLLDQHLRETCSLGTKSISFNNTIAEKLNALLKSSCSGR